VPLDALDTPEDIARKVFEIEKKLLPAAIQMMLKGTLNGQEVWDMV
jgi:folate-dependent phosphoribosylglycinamide formyltransferase PurN